MTHLRNSFTPSGIAGLVCVSIICCSLIFGFVYVWQLTSCHWTWGGTDVEARFQVPGGCQVKTEAGQWIPASKFRVVD